MGIFNKLFGQSQTKPQPDVSQTKTEAHKEEWDFYFSNVDDKLSSVFVDLGLHKNAPIKDKPNIIWISIKMNTEIEDNLVSKINSKFNSIYVGRLTSDGHRDLYFYVGDTTLYDKSLSEVMVAYPKYHFDYGLKEDKEWGGYFDFLYPLPQQYQSIQNRRVTEQLEKNGDKLTKPREVDHWIFFKKENDRNLFLNKIKSDGFIIVDKDYDKKLGELPFTLHIKRVDKVDWNSVDVYVIYLWKLATECKGDYDGWETSVEKD